jgi:cation diffusion facilitator CzcD-associated flavoprotein CzcO
MREHHDTVVIGGGQAGLAMSAVLQQRGREHLVLERRQVGERWRTERWESLCFQFPNWSLELPGSVYSGDDAGGFAHWREVLRVIEDYAARIPQFAEVVAPSVLQTDPTRYRRPRPPACRQGETDRRSFVACTGRRAWRAVSVHTSYPTAR